MFEQEKTNLARFINKLGSRDDLTVDGAHWGIRALYCLCTNDLAGGFHAVRRGFSSTAPWEDELRSVPIQAIERKGNHRVRENRCFKGA